MFLKVIRSDSGFVFPGKVDPDVLSERQSCLEGVVSCRALVVSARHCIGHCYETNMGGAQLPFFMTL